MEEREAKGGPAVEVDEPVVSGSIPIRKRNTEKIKTKNKLINLD